MQNISLHFMNRWIPQQRKRGLRAKTQHKTERENNLQYNIDANKIFSYYDASRENRTKAHGKTSSDSRNTNDNKS